MSCGLSFCSVENLNAQTLDWESFIENLLVDAETDSSWDNLYEDLCYLHENPININESTTEELVQLPFLTAQQIEEILAYVYIYGPMKTLGELNLIKGLNYETRQKLRFFLYCGEKSKQDKIYIHDLLKKGKNELVARTDYPFEESSGAYLGSDLYHSLRYKFRYKDKIEAGLTAEKDKGERGIDSYSLYALLKNRGILKKLIIGNYRLSFGHGLVLNTDFSLGKNYILSSSCTSGKGIKPHSSTRESNFFQGAASTVSFGKWELSTFLSYRKLDATLNKGTISSLKDDGYHRTELELYKKGNVQSQLSGGNISYIKDHFQLGLTTVYTLFSKPFYKNTSGYKLYYPVGHSFWNTSMNYGYRNNRLNIQGEYAVSAQGGWATLNTLSVCLFNELQLSFLYRYYHPKYNAIYGSSFSEGSMVKNEKGFYFGMNYPFSRSLNFSSYIDFFQFPYIRYGVSKPNTKGYDFLAELKFNSRKNFSWNIRYRKKSKQADYTENGKKGIAYTRNQKVKLQANYTFNDLFQGKSILNYNHLNEGKKSASRGYSFSQSFQYNMRCFPLQIAVNGIYFHTDDYDSRVFSYEQGLLYSFSIPSYYGIGYRFSTLLKYNLNSNLSLQCKYGFTCYKDRNINKNMLNIQLRYKF